MQPLPNPHRAGMKRPWGQIPLSLSSPPPSVGLPLAKHNRKPEDKGVWTMGTVSQSTDRAQKGGGQMEDFQPRVKGTVGRRQRLSVTQPGSSCTVSDSYQCRNLPILLEGKPWKAGERFNFSCIQPQSVRWQDLESSESFKLWLYLTNPPVLCTVRGKHVFAE